MEAKEIIGYNVKYYRHKKGITQEELAAITGFKTAFVSNMENGNNNITTKTIEKVCEGLGIEMIQLFDQETAQIAKNLPKRIDME